MSILLSVSRLLMIGVSGLVGAVVAIIGDIVQKDTASAVVKIAATVNSNLALSTPTIVWAGFLVVLGVVLCFIFEPESKRRAFFLGASVIALIMTATPYKPLQPEAPAQSIAPVDVTPWEVPGPQREASAEMNYPIRANLMVDGRLGHGRAFATMVSASDVNLWVEISVAGGGSPEEAQISVYDEGTGNRWQHPVMVTPGQTSKYQWAIRHVDRPRHVFARVESKRFGIINAEAVVQPDQRDATLKVELRSDDRPVWLRKLFGVYKF